MNLIYHRPSILLKLKNLDADLDYVFKLTEAESAPAVPARDRGAESCSDRHGLASRIGQAQLIHNLASIELQALELCVRTLAEFPYAPNDFRLELSKIALEEASHLKQCLSVLDELEFTFGEWPIQTNLWEATSSDDSLLDRILIVHRYLEGAGLDAGQAILTKLSQVAGGESLKRAIRTIAGEEIEHVAFGSRWYHKICEMEKIDSNQFFKRTIERLYSQAPKKEKIHRECRKKAGFTLDEIEFLEKQREDHLKQAKKATKDRV